jgi:hypothetical protein
MAREYVLDDPPYLRELYAAGIALMLDAVPTGLLLYPPPPPEAIAPLQAALDKIRAGVRLGDIEELDVYHAVHDADDARRREFRMHRRAFEDLCATLGAHEGVPTDMQLARCLDLLRRHPAATSAMATPAELADGFSRFPNFAMCEHRMARWLVHIDAHPAEPFFLIGFGAAMRMQSGNAPFEPAEEIVYWEPPAMRFDNRCFCFTGRFRSASRRECQALVMASGSTWVKIPTRATDYVVVASDGENTSAAGKPGDAMRLRHDGYPCFIVREETWLRFRGVEVQH